MKVVFDPAQKGHYPRHFLVNGVVEVNPEVPERADRLFAAAAGAGLAHVVPADPVRFYPFFWGHADERGEGTGLGYNYNLPLPRGTDDRAYMPAHDDAFRRMRAFAPGALVVALGLDAFQNDPQGGFAITTGGGRADRRGDRKARPSNGAGSGGGAISAMGSGPISAAS